MAGVSRGFRLAVVALGLAVVLAACADGTRHRASGAGTSSASGTAPSPSPVVTKAFSPYAATGTLVVPVADHLTGYCWTGSIAVPKAGIFRCLVGNAIYDPCFAPVPASAPAATVACIPDPWSPAHVVTLTQALPTTTPLAPRDIPWALELANSARCVAGTGTVPVVAGVPLNYVCGAGQAAGIVSNTRGHITVKYGSAKANVLTPVAVTTAWHG